MLQNFYQTFIRPTSQSQDSRNRELVLNFLLLAVFGLALVSLGVTIVSFIVFREHFFAVRTLIILAALAGTYGLYWLSRYRQQQRLVSFILVLFFFIIATFLVYQWGVLIPTGSLMFGLAIIMASILLGARYALYSLLVVLVVMTTVAIGQDHGFLQPSLNWMPSDANAGDLVGFYGVFGIIASISWLFNQQMERSLSRARHSEAALLRQKDLLEVKVEERTRQLETAQLEKVQQVYRFAELGRVSSALFHDLANHLTSMSLDIEGLEPAGRSDILHRIQHDIHYIDDVVQRVRFQLRGQSKIEQFDVLKEVKKVVRLLHYKLVQNQVEIQLVKPTRKLLYTNDVTRFRQLVMNLIVNAIESYPTPDSKSVSKREVVIKIEQKSDSIYLIINDWGVGVEPARLKKIFEPFYTDKSEGTGIGLFIVKQIVEKDLGGSIKLTSDLKNGTVFKIRLPL